MEKQIETLMQDIKSDYIKWSTSNGTKPISSYTQGVLDKFDDNIEILIRTCDRILNRDNPVGHDKVG